MSQVRIQRYARFVPVAASTATGQATTIRCGDVAGGMVLVAGASTNATRIALYGSNDDANYRPVYGSDGAVAEVVLRTGTDATYTLPDAAFGLRFVRLVPDANLGTAATVTVSMKS